jgi:hypothetical protein
MRSRKLGLAVAGAFAVVLALGFVVLSQMDFGESKEEAGDQETGEFPDFYASDDSLASAGPAGVEIILIGAEDRKPTPALPYCITLGRGRWACGRSDDRGHTRAIARTAIAGLEVFCCDDALQRWRDRAAASRLRPENVTERRCTPVSAEAPRRAGGLVFACPGW